MTKNIPYQYYTKKLKDGRIKTIAVSTYAGKCVRGTAICDFNDTYDPEVGQKIAAARCNVKVAEKRAQRAKMKRAEATTAVRYAQARQDNMTVYCIDADRALLEAKNNLDRLMAKV